MAQRNLFESMKMRPTSASAQSVANTINQAKQSVTNASKYIPVSTSMVPQYAILRQTLAIIEKNIKDGLIEDSDSYVTTNTLDGLRKLRDDILEVGAFAWDTEFDSLEHGYMDATLICVSIHNPKDDTDHYIPFCHCDTQKNILPDQVSYADFKDILGCVFEDPKIKKFSHQYASCDNIVLRNNTGIIVNGTYWDSLLFVNLIDENRTKGNSLKQLYTEWVLEQDGKEASYDDLFKGISFAFVPPHIARIYACKDSKMTWEVCHKEMQKASSRDYDRAVKHFTTTEAAQIDIVADMTFRGVSVDPILTLQLKDEYEQLQNESLHRMEAFAMQVMGRTINFASTQQLANLIYDVLHCQPVDKSKKCPEGTRGTGDEIIEKLSKAYPQIPIFNDIRVYRSCSKLLGTYINGIPEGINPKTGKVHGKWLSFGAKTSRYSSREPNLQNIPSHNNPITGKDDSRIRQMFIPGPGRVYLSSDYSQQEPRILGVMSQDMGIINAYREGKDLYSTMASQIYHVPYEMCLEKNGPECKARRGSVKNVLLGLMYGRQTASVAEQLHMTYKEGEQFIANFFATFPNIKKWIDDTVRNATLLGYCETIDGVRRHLPDLNSPIDFKRAEAQRQCQNSPIQGSAAGMTKRAMKLVHYDKFMIEHDAKIEIPVHDELVVSCPEQYKEEVGRRLKELMVEATGVLQDYFPIKCDVECYPKCWNDPDSYKLDV